MDDLLPVYDSIDEVPETYRGLFAEVKDEESPLHGKFRIKLGSAHGHELANIEKITSTNGAVRSERDNFERELSAWKGLKTTPAKVKSLLKRAEELEKFDPDATVDQKIKEREADLIEQHKADKEALTGRNDLLMQRLKRLLVENAAISALTEAGAGKYLKATLPYVREHTRMRETGEGDSWDLVVEVIDEKGNMRYGDAEGNPMTIPQLVAKMKTMDDFAGSFDGTGNEGGNTTGDRPDAEPKPKGGVLRIAGSDQRALNDNWEKIESGEAVVDWSR